MRPGIGRHSLLRTARESENERGSGEEAASHREKDSSRVELVTDEESFAMAKRLIREEGLFVGGSAGTNVAAALRVARRGGIDGPVVTVLPDSWDRYRSAAWMRA